MLTQNVVRQSLHAGVERRRDVLAGLAKHRARDVRREAECRDSRSCRADRTDPASSSLGR